MDSACGTTRATHIQMAVVVCTSGRTRSLEALVNSLVVANAGCGFNLYVIDQAYSIERSTLLKRLAERLPSGQVHHLPVDFVGLSRARNHGIWYSTEPIISFVDDDCVVSPQWSAATLRTLLESRTDGAFGRVLAHGTPVNITYVEHQSRWGRTWHATRVDGMRCDAVRPPTSPASIGTPCIPFAQLGSGNNMAFPRTTFLKYGTFDTRLGAGTPLHAAEDTEFQYRVLRGGGRLQYVPEMLAYHDGWRTLDDTYCLHNGYDVGVIAAFASYALQGDFFAARYVTSRVREHLRRRRWMIEHSLSNIPALSLVVQAIKAGWDLRVPFKG